MFRIYITKNGNTWKFPAEAYDLIYAHMMYITNNDHEEAKDVAEWAQEATYDEEFACSYSNIYIWIDF